MRRKILVTIALGAALAIIAAGTATSVTVGELQVDAPTDGVLPQCANLNDDDGDGLLDLDDPGCSGPLDPTEDTVPTPGGGSGGRSGGSTGGGSGSAGSGLIGGQGSKGGQAKKPGSGSGSGSGGGAATKGLFGKQKGQGKGTKETATAERQKIIQPTLRNPDGTPTAQNPGLT